MGILCTERVVLPANHVKFLSFMFVQKISTRVVCDNVKHPNFMPSRSFFGKCNLFVLIVKAIPGRKLLVLNFSLRSKRFRASSSRKLGPEQKIVMRGRRRGEMERIIGFEGKSFLFFPPPLHSILNLLSPQLSRNNSIGNACYAGKLLLACVKRRLFNFSTFVSQARFFFFLPFAHTMKWPAFSCNSVSQTIRISS